MVCMKQVQEVCRERHLRGRREKFKVLSNSAPANSQCIRRRRRAAVWLLCPVWLFRRGRSRAQSRREASAEWACPVLKFDAETLGHAIERLAVDAENLGGAFAVAAGRVKHVQQITALNLFNGGQTREQMREVIDGRDGLRRRLRQTNFRRQIGGGGCSPLVEGGGGAGSGLQVAAAVPAPTV